VLRIESPTIGIVPVEVTPRPIRFAVLVGDVLVVVVLVCVELGGAHYLPPPVAARWR
jgi:hypothetical protein